MRTAVKLLPVAERELRVAARRRGTYWVRFAAGAVAIAASAVILLAMMRESLAMQAQALTVTLAVLGFFYALLAGVLSTADCLSEEKREGTLGLLFLTDLRGYDVVAGKVVAHSIRAVSGLLALLPVLWLPVLMGAVSGAAVTNLVLVLVNTMFLSLSLGVLASSLTRDARFAIGGALLLVALLVVGLPLLCWLWVEYVMRPGAGAGMRPNGLPEHLGWVLYGNPAMLFFWAQAAMTGTWGAGGDFWIAFWVQHGMAWCALIGASVLVPRRWQDRTETARAAGPARKRDGGGSGTSGAGDPGAEDRADVLDAYPFGWVVARERRTSVVTWLGLGVVAVIWLWGFAEVREDWLQGIIGMWAVHVAGLWLKLRLALAACRHLHEHRRSGALELVLCTAQTPWLIVQGNLAGLRRQFLPPIIAVLAAAMLLLAAAIAQERGVDAVELTWMFAGLAGLVLLDLWALAWGGMWLGLSSARYVRALVRTVWWVMVLPWVAFLVSFILVGVSVETLGILQGFSPGAPLVLAWGVALSVGADLWMVGRSRAGLRDRLRDLALDHYGTETGGGAGLAGPVPVPAGGAGVGVGIGTETT